MKSTDFRNANFEKLRESAWLAGKRWEVYCAFLNHGPMTTRQAAQASGIDLLTVRPRTTELLQAGFVFEVLADGHQGTTEGVYVARTREEFNAWVVAQRHDEVSGQQVLL